LIWKFQTWSDTTGFERSSWGIRRFSGSDAPWRCLSDENIAHLSHTIAPLLRFSVTGSYPELQFENQTEQLALAHLKADTKEIEKLRARVLEQLSLLPSNIPEIRIHLEALTAAQTDAFWHHLACARIMQLQETFAPLMRFRNRRAPGTFVRLTLPDQIQRRHWIVFGPSGEGAFAATYRAQVEALVRELAGDNPSLKRLQQGEELTAGDIESIAAVCQAILDQRPEYIEEFDMPNAPALEE
jgi:type I restriction enzyme R subunit